MQSLGGTGDSLRYRQAHRERIQCPWAFYILRYLFLAIYDALVAIVICITVFHCTMLLAFRISSCIVNPHNRSSANPCCLACLDVGSVMGTSKRIMLAKALKEARAAKAGASSSPAANPALPPAPSPPPPVTAEACSSPSPASPPGSKVLPTPSSPPPIAAVP